MSLCLYSLLITVPAVPVQYYQYCVAWGRNRKTTALALSNTNECPIQNLQLLVPRYDQSDSGQSTVATIMTRAGEDKMFESIPILNEGLLH